MLKKISLLFLLPLAGAVTFYACKCTTDYGDFLKPYSLWVKTTDGLYNNANAYTTDSVIFETNLNLHCVAQSSMPANLFVNEAMATVPTRCPCGEAGFKKNITGMVIHTDSVYGGYAAGADVTSLFTGFTAYDYYPITQVPQKMREYTYANSRGGHAGVQLVLKQKPGNNLAHTFTFTVTTEDTVFTAKTEPFTWQ